MNIFRRPVSREKLLKWILFSVINAVIMTAGGYVINNLPIYNGDRSELYSLLHLLRLRNGKEMNMRDSVVAVNVAYDKQLTEVVDSNGFRLGQTDITDRGKLFEFLSVLDKADKYRYILLDVRFEKGLTSSADSPLFNLLSRMDRISIAGQTDIATADSRLEKKTAFAEYNVNDLSTGFNRYRIVSDSGYYIPAKMYSDLTGRKPKGRYGIYTEDGKLIQNSVFALFPMEEDSRVRNGSEFVETDYLNLGADILETMDEKEIQEMAEEKVVIIGDFVEDVHDTYVGKVAGPMVIYCSYRALAERNHYLSPWFLLTMFLIYFCMSMSLLMRTDFIRTFPFIRRINSWLVQLLAGFIGYSLIFLIIDTVNFLIFGVVYSFYFQGLYFALLQQILELKSRKNEEK